MNNSINNKREWGNNNRGLGNTIKRGKGDNNNLGTMGKTMHMTR